MRKKLGWRDFGVDKEEENRIRAERKFAMKIGLIFDDDMAYSDSAMLIKNVNNYESLKDDGIVYGLTSYSRQAYLRYELTRFRLAFISEADNVKYDYAPISEADMRKFYEENAELFTRANGDSFDFDEVKLIIKKKIRELEYEKNVSLLCEQL